MIKDIHNRGFIALISAILVSVALLTLVVAVSFEGFFGRFNLLDSQIKETSIYLAEACANTAILEVAQNDEYDPTAASDSGFKKVGDSGCQIVSVVPVFGWLDWPKMIQVYASSSNAYTNLEIEVDESGGDIVIDSWVEVANFP